MAVSSNEYYHYKSLRDNDKRASIILEEFQATIGVHYDFVLTGEKPISLEYEIIKHISELNSLRYKYGTESLYYKILHELIFWPPILPPASPGRP